MRPAQTAEPTPYPDINTLLCVLLSGVQATLGHRFVGLYVHGSVATSEFEPARSDIDFLVVTGGELPAAVIAALEEMHGRITASGLKWATKLEGSYIPQGDLRRYEPGRSQHPALRVDGTFIVDPHGSDWILQYHIIREQGIALAGPAPETLIDPVEPEDLRRAVQAMLREWWAPMLHDPVRLRSREYQAYAVLSMCRGLYTLRHGTVVSKPVAARWAQGAFGARWAALIERALAWPRGAQGDDLDSTLAFIRYALERSEQFGIPEDETRDDTPGAAPDAEAESPKEHRL